MAKKKVIGKIEWTVIKVKVKDVLPTPNNFKIKTELGLKMLQGSLGEFGLAGAIICNWAGKYGDKSKLILIDGNSRLEQAKEDGVVYIMASVPHKVLGPKQFTEMSAMYDRARAGEVDAERIDSELGASMAGFQEKYGMTVSLNNLKNMGANADQSLQFPNKKGSAQDLALQPVVNQHQVMLFFDPKQHPLFIKMEEKLRKRFKTGNATDTIFKALKTLCK